MLHRLRTSPALRRATVAAVAVLAAGVAGTVATPSAGADSTVSYAGSTSGTASTIILHKADQYERIIHPAASVTATLDDTTDTVTAASTSFAPAYSDTFSGPFNSWFYVGTQLEQQGGATGTVTDSATVGVQDISVSVTNRLRVTVYKVATQTTPQNPATDQKITLPTRCWTDLAMTLTGTVNRRTGDLQLAQDPFTVPPFPGDPGDTTNPPDPNDTNHRCQTATTSLNQQLAGTNNSVDLNFTGGPTNAHVEATAQAPDSQLSIAPTHPQLFQNDFVVGGTATADIDFGTGAMTNIALALDPIQASTPPESSQDATGRATFELLSPTGSLSSSGTAGIDNATLSGTLRLHTSVWEGQSTAGRQIADGTTCYVDVAFSATGTLDRGTNVLTLGQTFTLPTFPSGASLAEGCWDLGPGLTTNLSGPDNTISLTLQAG